MIISGIKIKERRKVLKMSRNALGKKLGLSRNTIYDWETGANISENKHGQALSKALSVDINALLEGSISGLEEPPGGVHETMMGYDPQTSKEFVFIKQVSGKISAGGGLVPDDSGDIRLAFRKEWFKKKGDPKNMSLIKVSGDSMEPTLLSGDLVLVDHSRNTIASQDGIYAISIDHEILIKRLHLLYQDSKILVISDNKQYPPQEISADKITINGKVIWYAREIER